MHPMTPNTYEAARRMSWPDLIKAAGPVFAPPLTIHHPIHPPYSRDFVHVEPSLCAIRRRIYPDLSVLDQETVTKTVQSNPQLYVQFALGDPPFVPDFRLTRLNLPDSDSPRVQADYWAYDRAYRLDYTCCPLDSAQSLLAIRGTVRNEGDGPFPVSIWIKLNLQCEWDMDPYHYEPYRWNQAQWRPCKTFDYRGSQFWIGSTPVARIQPHTFTARWHRSVAFPKADYKSAHIWNQPYVVEPIYRLPKLDHVLHLTRILKPGTSADFELFVALDEKNITPRHAAALRQARFESCHQRARRHFKKMDPPQGTRLEFPTQQWSRIFDEARQSTLQLLVDFQDGRGLMPTQGGSSERYYVWTWEAMCMLAPMLPLGYSTPVRKALEFLFLLQDGGCPPQGRFTSLAGAIGTTGPRWINATGSALTLAADYCRMTRDPGFIKHYLPRMIRAADWIVGEIKATRKLDPDGTRPPTYGLMPFGHATDGDVGFIYAFTDAYSFMGLDRLVTLLEELQHPRAADLAGERRRYRSDIRRTIRAMARPNGWIERRVPVPEEQITLKFETLIGPTPLAAAGLLDVFSPLFKRFQRYQETTLVRDGFMGNMDREVAYVGIGEWYWQDIYLRRGEWKKAFLALQTYLNYGVTPDTHQVQERFSRLNPAFFPWQPNGSGNGRLLEMMVKAIYFEADGQVTLLGGIPFDWLQQNGKTALRHLRTPTGRVSVIVRMLTPDRCQVTLMSAPAAGELRLRFPSHLKAQPVSPAVKKVGDNLFAVSASLTKVSFILGSARD